LAVLVALICEVGTVEVYVIKHHSVVYE